MKTRLVLTFIACGILPAFADQADVYYRQGMEAVSRGDAAAARAAFNEALTIRPDHPYARFQLGQLRNNEGSLVAKKREAQLAAVRLPQVALSEVSLSDALLALGTLIETESGKGEEAEVFTPNFMIKDPDGKLADREVTIQLKGVPAKVALDYILEQVGATARFDQHATVIRPAG